MLIAFCNSQFFCFPVVSKRANIFEEITSGLVYWSFICTCLGFVSAFANDRTRLIKFVLQSYIGKNLDGLVIQAMRTTSFEALSIALLLQLLVVLVHKLWQSPLDREKAVDADCVRVRHQFGKASILVVDALPTPLFEFVKTGRVRHLQVFLFPAHILTRFNFMFFFLFPHLELFNCRLIGFTNRNYFAVGFELSH